VVDDSKLNRKVMIKLMQSLGHSCDEACNGQEAIDMVKESLMIVSNKGYDIILMDNQMPVMLGCDATRIIRLELKYTGVIFGVTGNVLQADIDDFFDSGVDDIILKPLTTAKFEFSFNNTRLRKKYFKTPNMRASRGKLNELKMSGESIKMAVEKATVSLMGNKYVIGNYNDNNDDDVVDVKEEHKSSVKEKGDDDHEPVVVFSGFNDTRDFAI
jgi:CheY-like chemotaxis protein